MIIYICHDSVNNGNPNPCLRVAVGGRHFFLCWDMPFWKTNEGVFLSETDHIRLYLVHSCQDLQIYGTAYLPTENRKESPNIRQDIEILSKSLLQYKYLIIIQAYFLFPIPIGYSLLAIPCSPFPIPYWNTAPWFAPTCSELGMLLRMATAHICMHCHVLFFFLSIHIQRICNQ